MHTSFCALYVEALWRTIELICVCNFPQKDDNNLGFDFAKHGNIMIIGVQNHSYINGNVRPNI
jgi:hypothetical protein